MEKPPIQAGRSRVHFNASNEDEESGPTVNVASFEPNYGGGADDVNSTAAVIPESISKDITDAKSSTSFYFEGDEDEEEIRSEEDTEQINRFLRFKSPSAPTSPQSSPFRSPESFPQHRSSDIPLLELTRHTPESRPTESRPSSGDTAVDNERKRQSTDEEFLGKKEANRLIREHTRRGPTNFFRRLSSQDSVHSGASTPEDGDNSKHYTFNSGVLTNLLKLYRPG
jgi:hypothetical protein